MFKRLLKFVIHCLILEFFLWTLLGAKANNEDHGIIKRSPYGSFIDFSQVVDAIKKAVDDVKQSIYPPPPNPVQEVAKQISLGANEIKKAIEDIDLKGHSDQAARGIDSLTNPNPVDRLADEVNRGLNDFAEKVKPDSMGTSIENGINNLSNELKEMSHSKAFVITCWVFGIALWSLIDIICANRGKKVIVRIQKNSTGQEEPLYEPLEYNA